MESISVWYSLNKRLHIEYMGNCMERNQKISPNEGKVTHFSKTKLGFLQLLDLDDD